MKRRRAPLATFGALVIVLATGGGATACSSSGGSGAGGGAPGGGADAGAALFGDGGGYVDEDAGSGAHPVAIDGGYAYDGGVVRADRFVTNVVSFLPGDCAGFGASAMPTIVEGPPVGGGNDEGSLDVVSLGNAGSIVVTFGANAIVDGPGPDFLVFENAFLAAGDPTKPAAEPGEVSVSDDGRTWTTFPCTATSYPYGACAGWHPVYSSPDDGISPIDPAVAGGDAFDLHDVGLTHARYVRIVDKTNEPCPTSPADRLTTNGFDLDAIAIVNAATP